MRRFFQVKHILLITALFTTDCTCQVNKEIESFVKLPVHIPYQEMDQRVCSMYADSLSTGKTLRLVNYIVSLDCSTCALSHMAAAENLMKNQDELKGVKSVYVIETSSKEAESLYFAFCNARIEGTVYLDTCHAFRRANPHIPDNPLFHTFLLNDEDSVLLVGDPFKNEKMERLFLKVIERERERKGNKLRD